MKKLLALTLLALGLSTVSIAAEACEESYKNGFNCEEEKYKGERGDDYKTVYHNVRAQVRIRLSDVLSSGVSTAKKNAAKQACRAKRYDHKAARPHRPSDVKIQGSYMVVPFIAECSNRVKKKNNN